MQQRRAPSTRRPLSPHSPSKRLSTGPLRRRDCRSPAPGQKLGQCRRVLTTKLNARRQSKATLLHKRKREQHASPESQPMLFPQVLATRDSEDSPRQQNAMVTTGAGHDARVHLPPGDAGPSDFPGPRRRPGLAEDKGETTHRDRPTSVIHQPRGTATAQGYLQRDPCQPPIGLQG